MKYRTFLTTFLLFLFSFHLGILLVSFTMFKGTLKHAEERSLAEHYIITSALVKDFHAIESRGIHIDESVDSLLQPYNYFSGDKRVNLVLYKNDQPLFPNQQKFKLESNFSKLPEDGSRLMTFEELDERTYVLVSGKLPVPYDSYATIYLYDTTDAIATWKKMKNTMFVVGLIISIFLALGLLVLLNRIFKPLTQISQTSRNIAAGAYETRLPEFGDDELYEMSQNFNYMAEEIQRQMGELISVAAKKQQFVDNFAHELHTPLTSIYGYAEYLQKAALTEDDRHSAISHIISESRRMQELANQLLDLANLRNDQVSLEAQNVTNLFQSIQRTLRSKIIEKEIRFDLRSEIDVLWGDPLLLKSLFINLVDNAIKACGTKGHIVVHTFRRAEMNIVCIRDDGKGMTPEIIQHITEPFYRVEKSRNRKDGGTGLGLSICQQIVVLHNAEMRFTSHMGKGTEVKVIFTTPS